MLVEFERSKPEVGEDEIPVFHPIAINPERVAAVFERREDYDIEGGGSHCIVRMAAGGGFSVRGSYREVMSKLNGSTTQAAAIAN